MRNPLLAPDLKELIAERDEHGLRDFFNFHHPATAAELLEDLEPEEILYILKLLDARPRAEVFTYLEPRLQDALVEVLDRESVAALLSEMRHDERADLVTRLPEERVEQILPLLARVEREDIRRLTSYEESTAGAVMTSEYAALPPDVTAAKAIEMLRQIAPDRETIYYCFVLDSQHRLIGLVSLKDLILAPPTRLIKDIMETQVVSASVDDDQEAVAQMLAEYDLLALPILDREGRLVGIVTHDDVIDVMVEEATEDVYRMGAVAPMVENYLEASFFTVWYKRAIWLSCLFVLQLVTFNVMAEYVQLIGQLVILNLFLPLCISTGGNSGSQAATLITRAMALGHVGVRDWFRVLKHELGMGAALGLTLGVIGFIRAYFVSDKLRGNLDPVALALTISFSVAAICLWGTLMGSILPMFLKRLGLDPAFASSPFVATSVDVTGIIIYFSIAQYYLF